MWTCGPIRDLVCRTGFPPVLSQSSPMSVEHVLSIFEIIGFWSFLLCQCFNTKFVQKTTQDFFLVSLSVFMSIFTQVLEFNFKA
jgi:hypothetical protein